MLAALAPVISLSPPTATSVTVSWSQPMSSFDVQHYQVSVARITSCNGVVIIRGPRHQLSTDMQEDFEDLEESIEYRANITAVFHSTHHPLSPASAYAVMDFTTLPTG